MNKLDAIDALRKTRHHHNWDGPVMGNNSISDFVLGAGAHSPAEAVSGAIREAVNNRIAAALSSASGNREDAWTAWCQGAIDADFSDIQKIVDDID